MGTVAEVEVAPSYDKRKKKTKKHQSEQESNLISLSN